MSRESHHETLLKVRRTHTAWVDAPVQPADGTRLFQPASESARPIVRSHYFPAGLRRGYTSVLSVPTMTNERLCGVLSLYFSERETYQPEIADLRRERLAHAHAAFARSAQRDRELRNPADLCPQHIGRMDSENIAELKSPLEAEPGGKRVVPDLRDITLGA